MSEITDFYQRKPLSGGVAKNMVIMLHGLGADGRDLMGLVPELEDDLPDTVFIAPDAPAPCDMAPMGYQWFSLQSWTPESMLAGARDALPALEAFITNQLQTHNIMAGKLALLGFSQGTMMSLYAAPRLKSKIAGVVGFSGAMVGGFELMGKDHHKMPVLLVHGEADMVVPVSAYTMARENLESLEFPLEGFTVPGLAHSIDEAGLAAARKFLARVLGGNKP